MKDAIIIFFFISCYTLSFLGYLWYEDESIKYLSNNVEAKNEVYNIISFIPISNMITAYLTIVIFSCKLIEKYKQKKGR